MTNTSSPQASSPTITLGGGCFWCTEAVFVRVKGVLDVESGYCNGHTSKPSYADVCAGTQYRSGIYLSDEADRVVAQQVLNEVNAALSGRVVTELTSLDNYSAAEAYHQDYFEHNPNQGYRAFVVAPKVQKFVKTFADKVKQG